MKIKFPEIEAKILDFWKKNKIFEKSISQRKKAKNFRFYDGPITVNARPGIHHVLARIFKDIIPRFKTMQGFRVLRKNGWDTHGLPVELEVEKDLGFKTKKDIEEYGVGKFNQACKENVQKYIPLFRDFTEKIGYWVDMDNSYITYKNDYIETIWWILGQIFQKGFLYKSYKVVPYCPRCGTSLSSHEVAQGYKKIKEPSVYLKFKIRSKKLETREKDSYFLVWTTTPWTLPGNVAVAVNPDITYAKVKIEDQFFILAKERIEASGVQGEIIDELKGEDLLGVEYEPLFNLAKEGKAYRAIPGDFVSIEEGTGLVHIAPAFGEEDMQEIKAENAKIRDPKDKFPVLITVDEEGKMKTPGYKWDGIFVKEADPLITEDLKQRNILFKEELYEHDYPFCWRCKSPLLYYAKQSWFINMQKVKRDLIKNNQDINWIPSHLKEGRFGEWLREVKDWALSRERYWGTPLPIWRCGKCGYYKAISSKENLVSQKYTTNKYFILRHGETTAQARKEAVLYDWPGTSSFPLTENGKKDIAEMVKKIKNQKIDLIYASDALRTRQTAKIVAKELGLEIKFVPGLRDINVGIYQKRKTKEFKKDYPPSLIRFSKKIPGGESWLDIKKRALHAIRDIEKRNHGKTILIVSHGDPLWLLEGLMKGWTNEQLLEEKIQKGVIRKSELREIEFKNLPYNENGELDFHRPYIDKVKFSCEKCDGLMEREGAVLDCWFDSGAMPFAQYHYPFENEELVDKGKQFPADYISEAIDQTRGWFYTLLAISTLLEKGTSFKSVLSLGLVLDEKGEKMSKSKGNIIDIWGMIDKYGADSIRWYFYTVNQPYDDKPFSERLVKEALRRFLLTFWNIFIFFETYGLQNAKEKQFLPNSKNILDRWIVSQLNVLILEVTKDLEKFDITTASRKIEKFLVEDFSQWYIQVSRQRFQRPETEKEIKESSETLKFVLFTLLKLTAPFVPFFAENIYQKFKDNYKLEKDSVHLEDWPKVNEKFIDNNLNEKMERVHQIVALGLRERAKLGIKVRQPLQDIKVSEKLIKGLEGAEKYIIRERLNIKNLKIDSKLKEEVKLNTEITLQLKKEGMVREVIRSIQEMRKKAGLKPKDKILVYYLGSSDLNAILGQNRESVLKEARAEAFQLSKTSKTNLEIEQKVKIGQGELWLAIKRMK